MLPDPNAVLSASRETEDDKAARLENERQMIEDGEQLEKFLNLTVVKDAFAGLGKGYHAEWLGENEPEKRDLIWAKSKALLDLAKELRAVFARGRVAQHARQIRTANEERAAGRRKQRPGS